MLVGGILPPSTYPWFLHFLLCVLLCGVVRTFCSFLFASIMSMRSEDGNGVAAGTMAVPSPQGESPGYTPGLPCDPFQFLGVFASLGLGLAEVVCPHVCGR